MDKYIGTTCFVIMPFGDKTDLDGKPIHFDEIYKTFIKDAVEDMGITCVRCDEIAEAGWIHFKMFQHIFDAEVAVVDITSLNANVFYELGIRHALKKNVTIIIRKKGTPAPFNIAGFTILEYQPDDPENLKQVKEDIQKFIKNGLASNGADSPVYKVIENLKVESRPRAINKKETILHNLLSVPGKQIGLITGDIQNIKDVDIWVNSENTNMQMSRPHERSISAVIRYLGAKKTRAGHIIRDVIAKELHEATGGLNVDPSLVIDTGAGELTNTHKVKKIFHAAAVVGQVGQGYSPIPNISECIRNSLKLVDYEPRLENDPLKSILFPLMGTGTTKMSAQEIAGGLIDEAISYLEENPNSKIERVFFLAYNEQDLEICQRIIAGLIRDEKLSERILP